MRSFVIDFFHLACFQGSLTLYHGSILRSFFLQPSNILLHRCILFIHSSADEHLCGFYFLAIVDKEIMTFICKSLCQGMFSFLLDIPRGGIAESLGNSVFNCQSGL